MDKQNKKFEMKTYKIFQILPEMYCILSIPKQNLAVAEVCDGVCQFYCKIAVSDYAFLF